jgi:hypothetical protein
MLDFGRSGSRCRIADNQKAGLTNRAFHCSSSHCDYRRWEAEAAAVSDIASGVAGEDHERDQPPDGAFTVGVGAMRGSLSKQRSPTPQHEAEHPEQRRHHVDGNEHTKHQRVVEEGRGVPIDRDR